MHREGAGGKGHVGGGTLARGNPGTFVTVFRASRIEPAAVGKLVGDGFPHFVAAHDSDAGLGSEAIKIGPTTGPGIGDVRQVAISNIAVGRGSIAMVGAVLRPEAGGAVSVRGGDDVLHAGIGRGGLVPEVGGRLHRFRGDLRLRRMLRCAGRVVDPDATEDAGRVSGGRSSGLGILGDAVQPGAAAHTTVKGLQNSRLTRGVIVVPLGAPEHQSHSLHSGCL